MAGPLRYRFGVEKATSLDIATRRTEGSGFWRALGDHVHACRIHDSEESLLETLTGFVGGALWAGEAAIVIANDARLLKLDTRLRQTGLDLLYLRFSERYLPLSIDALLPQLLVDGRPDAARFREAIGEALARARRNGEGVRVFGELGEALWERGDYAGAVRLEQLWNEAIQGGRFQVLCAYPRASFMKGPVEAATEVRAAHSAMLAG